MKNLYQELKKDGIGTMKVERMSEKLCDTLPKHRRRTLVKIIINWKLQDAHKELREHKRINTETWHREKETIASAGVLDAYKRLWRREITKYENDCNAESEMRNTKYHKKT